MKHVLRPLLILLLLFCSNVLCSGDDIILVVSKENSLNKVSKSELKKLYIGKQTTLDNTFINPTILKVKSIHKVFLEEYLQLNARQFARIWQKLVFTGKGQMPNQYTSEQELIRILTDNPEKVGYIPRKMITDDLKEITVTP